MAQDMREYSIKIIYDDYFRTISGLIEKGTNIGGGLTTIDIDNRARTVDCKGLIVRWIALFHP